eukprot:762751-Hanusia_phi.AAC.2
MFVEPLAAACQIVQQVHVKAEDDIAVIGTGKLGILICQVLKAVGGKVTAFGRRKETFKPFEKRNIPCVLVSENLSDKKFDIVVDCTGNEKGFDTALRFRPSLPSPPLLSSPLLSSPLLSSPLLSSPDFFSA